MWKAKGVALLCLLALGCFIVAGAMSMSEAVSYDQYFASAYEQDFDSLEMDMPFLYRAFAEDGLHGAETPGWDSEEEGRARAEMLLYCVLYERVQAPDLQLAAQVRSEALQAVLLKRVMPEPLYPEEIYLPLEDLDPAMLENCLETVAAAGELEVLQSAIWGCEIDLALAGDLCGYARLFSELEAIPLYDDDLCALLYELYLAAPDSRLGKAAYHLEFTIESLRLRDDIFSCVCEMGDGLEGMFSGSMELIWQALLESWETDGVSFEGIPARGSEAAEWLAGSKPAAMRWDLQQLCQIEDFAKQKVAEGADNLFLWEDVPEARRFCQKVDFLSQVRHFGLRLLSLDADAMARDAAVRENLFCFPEAAFAAFTEDLSAFLEDFAAVGEQKALSRHNDFLAHTFEQDAEWEGICPEPVELPEVSVPEARERMRNTAARWLRVTLRLSQEFACLTVGGSLALHVETTPEGVPVTWESSDETVAMVDADGFVTACGSGSAEVSAVCGNGISESCEITVFADNSDDLNGDGRIDGADLQILLEQQAEKAAQMGAEPEAVSAERLAALAQLLYGDGSAAGAAGAGASLGKAETGKDGTISIPVFAAQDSEASAVVAAVEYDAERLALGEIQTPEKPGGTVCVRQGEGKVGFAWYETGTGMADQPLTLCFKAADKELSGLTEVTLKGSAAGGAEERAFESQITVSVGEPAFRAQIDRVEFRNGQLSCRVLSTEELQGTVSQLLTVFSKNGFVTGYWPGTAVLSQNNLFTITGEVPEYDCIQLFLVTAEQWEPISEMVEVAGQQ